MLRNGAMNRETTTDADRTLMRLHTDSNMSNTAQQTGLSRVPTEPRAMREARRESKQPERQHSAGQHFGGHDVSFGASFGGFSGGTLVMMPRSDAARLALAQIQANQEEQRERREHEMRMRQLDLAIANVHVASGVTPPSQQLTVATASRHVDRPQSSGQRSRHRRGRRRRRHRGARQLTLSTGQRQVHEAVERANSTALSTRQRQGDRPVEQQCQRCRDAGRSWTDHDPWNCADLTSEQRRQARKARKRFMEEFQAMVDSVTASQAMTASGNTAVD